MNPLLCPFCGGEAARQTDRALRDEIQKHQTNVRHWREECGKLHAQVATAKDQRNEYQKREQSSQQILAAIRKVRDGYADQAKFADIDEAVHFREFVRRMDLAVAGKSGNPSPQWGGTYSVSSKEAK